MAKVALRVYNREIESMIEGGRLDEAVAHCQYILKTFPMYVGTYRLLGKSYLEARRYTDAADIFERTLMAVPDDFVAHVGMSIIRDDEGKLDDAIWHMERAFEDQPSNAAIQSELRRLYGRRDGIEPPKIRLSRDALANMYSQGELYNQAIVEIRAVLAEDTNRPDLQVMLARAYYHAGQKVEAAEAAANLLKKYAYCLDALRILVDVLPEAAQTENTQVYRQRLHMLDPYSSFVTGSVFNTDQVADTVVTLERLEYIAGAVPTSTEPDWASSLGIKLVDEKRIEPTPDWIKPGDSNEKTAIPPSEPSGSPAAPVFEDKSVPEWMRSAGWKESSGKVREEQVDLGAQQPAEPLSQGEMPDWLKSMAPQQITEPESGKESIPTSPPSSGDGDIPEWLKGLSTAGTAHQNLEPSQSQPESQEKNLFPDWLKEMDDSASAVTEAPIAADKVEQPQPEEALSSTQPSSPLQVAQEPTEQEVAVVTPEVKAPFQPTGEPRPLNIEEDAMAWLESLAAKQGAKEEELLTKPETRSSEMPDWLRSAEEQPPTSATPEPSPALSETLPMEPYSEPAGESATPTDAHPEEIPSLIPAVETAQLLTSEADNEAGVASLAAEQVVNPEELSTQILAPSEEIPPQKPIEETVREPVSDATLKTWRDSFTPEPVVMPEEVPPQPPAPSEQIPPLEPAEETEQSLVNEAETKTWLEGLATEQIVKPEEVPPQTLAPLEEIPLQKPIEDTPPPFNIEPDTQVWMANLVSEQPGKQQEVPPQTPAPSEEIGPPESTEGTVQTPLNEAETKPWMERLATEQKAAPEEVQPQIIQSSIEIPSSEPIKEPSKPLSGETDAEAWLEGFATGQNVKPEEFPAIPSERTEPPPEWIQKEQESVASEQPSTPEIPKSPPEEDITITSWLSKHDVEEALGKVRSAPATPLPEKTTSNELPDWLKGLEQPTKPPESPRLSEDVPDWLSQPVQPTEKGAESVPAPSPSQEQEMPAWIDETIPVSEPPAPTTSEEWVSVDEKTAAAQDLEPAAKPGPLIVDTPLQRQILGGTGMLSLVPPEDKDAEYLSAAQTALDAKQIQEAMQAYKKLIKKNRLLDEVIHDLREAIYRFPVDIIIWQTLGDASMRANRLQDALDAYTKAEELLR